MLLWSLHRGWDVVWEWWCDGGWQCQNVGECSHDAREDWGNMAKVLTADGRGSVKMLTKMVYPSLDLAGTLTFWWGLQDAFIRPKKPCLKTVGTSQNWCQGWPCDKDKYENDSRIIGKVGWHACRTEDDSKWECFEEHQCGAGTTSVKIQFA